jgi:hypothetical protein
VKALGRRFDRQHSDGWGKGSIESEVEIQGRDGGFERKGGNLGEGVDTRVGAARALGEDCFASDAVESLGEDSLNGGESWLDLPAIKGGAVVSKDGFPELHEDRFDGNRHMRFALRLLYSVIAVGRSDCIYIRFARVRTAPAFEGIRERRSSDLRITVRKC